MLMLKAQRFVVGMERRQRRLLTSRALSILLETAVSEEKEENQTSMLERKNQNCPYLPHMRSYV